jgi:hypothetical protein
MSHDKFSDFLDSEAFGTGPQVTFLCECGESITAADDHASIERAQSEHRTSATE